MAYQFNFGGFTGAGEAPPIPAKRRKFRLAVLGDFSARANRGELETGEALSNRKPLTIAADTLDHALARLSPRLGLAIPGSGTVELTFASMDDFHPDALYEKLEIFSRLSGLRQRLKTSATFAKAAQELRAVSLAPAPTEPPPAPPAARGAVLPVDAQLDDFARFLGQPTAIPDDGTDPKASLDAFLRGIVAPYVSAGKDPQQDKLVAAVDTAVGAMMREVLHHPDFQALESLWRSLAFLATRLETDESLEVVLLDLSAEEFAADLSAATQLDATALYRILYELPQADARAGLYSAVVANYVFERTPAHADLLGRAAIIASAAQAPFVASVPAHTLDVKPADVDPFVRDAWSALRSLPEAAYLGLGNPRFLLRLPYGQKTEPVESFKFEEYTVQAGPSALLWASPAVAAGLLLAETFRQQGEGMQVGTVAGIGELPYYTYEDADGDETALPCTERLLTASMQEAASGEGLLPLLALKNSPEIRVGTFTSVGGGPLWGWWAGPLPAATAPAAPEAAAEATPADALAPEAAPAAEGTGDAELDSLLSSLDAPAAPAEPPASDVPAPDASPDAPAEPALEAAGGDPELDAMLAALNPVESPLEPAAGDETGAAPLEVAATGDTLATEPPPEPTDEGAADPELDAMLAALNPVEPLPEAAPTDTLEPAPPATDEAESDPELDAMFAGSSEIAPPEAPAEETPALSPPEESDPELDAMLASLEPVAFAPASPETSEPLPAAAEAAPEDSPGDDPALDAMLAALQPLGVFTEPLPADDQPTAPEAASDPGSGALPPASADAAATPPATVESDAAPEKERFLSDFG